MKKTKYVKGCKALRFWHKVNHVWRKKRYKIANNRIILLYYNYKTTLVFN